MIALGLFDLLKGLDFEETIAHLGCGRGPAFRPGRLPRPPRPDHAALGDLAGARCSRWSDLPSPCSRPGRHRAIRARHAVVRETGDLLRWQRGPIALPPPLIPLARPSARARHVAGDRLCDLPAAAAVAALPGPGSAPGRSRARASPRRRHAVVLQAARRPALLLQRGPARVRRLPDRERRAAAVGRPGRPADALPGLLHELRAFAELRGLKLGARRRERRLRPLYEELGLRTIYLGDEAIVELERRSRSKADRSARSASR